MEDCIAGARQGQVSVLGSAEPQRAQGGLVDECTRAVTPGGVEAREACGKGLQHRGAAGEGGGGGGAGTGTLGH